MAAEVIDLTASQPDVQPKAGTSGRQQGAALGLDLAASPRAAAHRRRQRPPAEPVIDLTADDEENWQTRPTKRHRAETQWQQQREPWLDGGWHAEPAAAVHPLQQRSQGAHYSPPQPRYSPEPPSRRQQQQQQQQQREEEVDQMVHQEVQQQQQPRPASPPAQQQEERRQDVQQEAAGQQEEAQAQQRCDICFDDEIAPAFMHTFASCKHSFCLPCLREYIAGKIADCTFPVPCPLPDCKAPISAAECGLVLTPEEAATLGKMEAEAAIGEGARLFCPNPQCSMLLLNDDKQADAPIDCPYCQKQLCANCGVAWHAGMTCQQYQAQPDALRSKEDQALLDLAEQEGMRRCPACGAMVMRTEGCSYMTCRCGNHFCYGCGKRKERGANHYCNCKPAHEQWLNAPPAIAAQLQAHAANAAARDRAREHAAARAARAQEQAVAYAARAREQAAAQAAQVQQYMQQRQRQRRARRGAAGEAAANQQQAQQAQQQAVVAAAAGAAAGLAAAMQVPPLPAGPPGVAAAYPPAVPFGPPGVAAYPPAVPFGLPPPLPVGGAYPGLPPGMAEQLNQFHGMMNAAMEDLQRLQRRHNNR